MYTVSREALERALYEADFDPDDYDRIIHADYSGRAMYGEKCLAIVHASQGELLKFAIGLSQLTNQMDFEGDFGGREPSEWLPDARSDNWGRYDMITYWPGVTMKEAE